MTVRWFAPILSWLLVFAGVSSILEAAEVVGRITDADTGKSLQGAIIRDIPLARSLWEIFPAQTTCRSFILLPAKLEGM